MEDFCQLSNLQDSSVAKAVRYDNRRIVYETDVVIIGNGPSALALSSFLSGNRPYFDAQKGHPNASLNEKLLKNVDQSIIVQDFVELSEGLEGRSSHPVSLLYDSLVRPNADLGEENPSSLKFIEEPTNSVAHVVLGKGTPGGSWNEFSPEILTLSYASWLDLPAYSFRQWLEKEGANFATELEMTIDASAEVIGRVPCAAVQRYFKDYTKRLNIEKHFLNFAYVTCVRKLTSEETTTESPLRWEIHGCHSSGPFYFRAKALVLAVGIGVPKSLGLPHENDDFRRVFHSITELERVLPKLIEIPPNRLKPVLVVGDGLSAADAIIKLLIAGIPVVHSFRKTPRDTKNVLSKLSSTVYPEYHTVFRLMTSSVIDPLYVAYQRTEVIALRRRGRRTTDDDDVIVDQGENDVRTAVLKHVRSKGSKRQNATDSPDPNDGHFDVEFSYAIILIGFQADLSFFADNGRFLVDNGSKPIDSKSNVISVNPFTYQCRNDSDLSAVGPLVGDNFVRYTVGGAMAAAANLCMQIKGSKMLADRPTTSPL